MKDPAALARQILSKGRPVLAAVSGGADSMALLCALREWGYDVIAASFDHQIRGEAGTADVAHVQNFCHKGGIRFVAGSGNVPAHAVSNHLSMEEAARDLRYRFLFDQAQIAGAQAVATGHTAEDQAETMVMHFLRGSGLSGLKGMQASVILSVFNTELPIVRPLLEWTRADTVNYCQQKLIPFIEDETNQQEDYLRNRIRLRLMPDLKQYNNGLVSTLSRSAMVLQGEAELLEQLTSAKLRHALLEQGKTYLAFDRGILASYPRALFQRVIRMGSWQLLPTLRDIDKEALDRANLNKPADLGAGLQTLPENGILYLTTDTGSLPTPLWPQMVDTRELKQGTHLLQNGWLLLVDWLDDKQSTDEDGIKGNNVVTLPAENLRGVVKIRPTQPGDRFEPFGMAHQTIKLSDLFVNNKVPRRYRGNFPVVADDDSILWVPGLRRSERTRSSSQSTRFIRLELVPPGDLNQP